MQLSPKNPMSKFAANSETVPVSQYLPHENTVVLRNGRKIQYDQLVIASGLRAQSNQIKGFEEAWADPTHPVYSNADHPSWKSTSTSQLRYIHNYQGGEAIFYIPPYPFHTEVENYNFLLAKSYWDQAARLGRLSWDKSRVTVINANSTFCQFYERGDAFIKEQCEKRQINVEYGLKLIEVNKDTHTAKFQNIKTGEVQERPYGNLYALQEARADPILTEAGLAASNGLLDVDPHTLLHRKHANIFGLGDVNNLPTTKTFYAGFNQLSVVRHNVERHLNGLAANAKYDGFTKADIQLGIHEIATLSHLYDGVAQDSLSDGFVAGLRYRLASFNKKGVMNLLKFKNWGPPYYKFKKTFNDPAPAAQPAGALHPDKKTA